METSTQRWRLILCCDTSTLQRLIFDVAQLGDPQHENSNSFVFPNLMKDPTPFSIHSPYQRHE